MTLTTDQIRRLCKHYIAFILLGSLDLYLGDDMTTVETIGYFGDVFMVATVFEFFGHKYPYKQAGYMFMFITVVTTIFFIWQTATDTRDLYVLLISKVFSYAIGVLVLILILKLIRRMISKGEDDKNKKE